MSEKIDLRGQNQASQIVHCNTRSCRVSRPALAKRQSNRLMTLSADLEKLLTSLFSFSESCISLYM